MFISCSVWLESNVYFLLCLIYNLIVNTSSRVNMERFFIIQSAELGFRNRSVAHKSRTWPRTRGKFRRDWPTSFFSFFFLFFLHLTPSQTQRSYESETQCTQSLANVLLTVSWRRRKAAIRNADSLAVVKAGKVLFWPSPTDMEKLSWFCVSTDGTSFFFFSW